MAAVRSSIGLAQLACIVDRPDGGGGEPLENFSSIGFAAAAGTELAGAAEDAGALVLGGADVAGA